MWRPNRRELLPALGGALSLRASERDDLLSLWARAPSDNLFMPRTRWWWPGSRATREGITRQLEQMRAGGIGGAEIVHTFRLYRQGNLSFLSPERLELLRHAISEAARLDMKIALTPSPGWDFGGPWFPPEHRSKCLAPAWLDLQGPFQYEGPLPPFRDFGTPKTGLFEFLSPVEGHPPGHMNVLAVVGARLLSDTQLHGASLVDLTEEFRGEAGRWRVEEGRWRLFAFRLVYTGQRTAAQNDEEPSWVADHLDRRAMEQCIRHVTRAYQLAFGPALGRTVDSIFSDSFEVVPLANTLLWSSGTLDEFRRRKGYDLRRWLPALWFGIGPDTPRIRYDVNEFLHQIALEFVFQPFLDACRDIGVRARMQPHYRFNEEIIQGAGLAHVPETEVTTARFETVADPRKATVSGARFYGREVVSAEAYTFIHRERYRSTPEELKRATDAFLRDGITRFYNHGWVYFEQPELDPALDVMPAAERISPWVPWWLHYKGLAAYIARCCALLRQGRFIADVLLYSPQAQVWRETALFGVAQRVMKYGGVPGTLLANGYDYDLVNDHLLQTRASIGNGSLEINGYRYRALLLTPRDFVPEATLALLNRFASSGGLLLALDRAPQGLDARVVDYGFTPNQFSPQEQPYSKTPPLRPGQIRLLETLRQAVLPQFLIGTGQQSDGLTFHQRELDGGLTLFFVTNLQPEPARTPVTFRVRSKWPEIWDPLTGAIRPAQAWREKESGVEVDVDLEPWHSCFLLFRPGSGKPEKRRRRQPRQVITLDTGWSRPLGDARTAGVLEYSIEFTCPRRDASLDLGQVGCACEAFLNDAPLGSRWMAPFRYDIPARLLRNGRNHLVARVATPLMPAIQKWDRYPLREELLDPPPPQLLRAFERDRQFQPWPFSGLGGPVRLSLY
ncbi:MAG: glycosyl hydrolase [Bryobacteraceae bacterium]